MTERRSELAARLSAVEERVAAAATGAGRSPEEITVVVVTKTWPASDVEHLYDLGVRHFGESRHPEAEDKAAALAGRPGVVWHFVGQVQSNKAARIAGYADVVHSVDSVRVAQRLNSGAHRFDRTVRCLVQVSLDPPGTAGRGGVPPEQVPEVAEAVETAGGLRLAGVMGVAPLEGDAVTAFERLAAVSAELVGTYPEASCVSAGMSGDFEEAINAGATHVRIGAAVLGARPPIR